MESTTIHWIKVSDSLPDGWNGSSSKTVLAVSPSLGIVLAEYMRSTSFGDGWVIKGVSGPCKITHWMHLPPLPTRSAP